MKTLPNGFAEEIRKCMSHGVGNGGDYWTRIQLMDETGISDKTINSYEKGKTFPDSKNKQALLCAFFPTMKDKSSVPGKRFLRAWTVERNRREEARAGAAEVNNINFSLRNMWVEVLKTSSDSFDTLVTGSSTNTKLGGFAVDQVVIKSTKRQFFIQYPERLREAVEAVGPDKIAYDLHASKPEYLGNDFTEYARHFPEGFLADRIKFHSEIYAEKILQSFGGEGQNKPYNKLKFGVYSVSSRKTTGEEECDVAEIDVYVTDYFTNWTISQVYKDIRALGLSFLKSFDMYPSFQADAGPVHLPILAPSIGLNCVIITKETGNERRMTFAQLQQSSSNFIQHNKIHLPVNEGMNLEDLIPNSDSVSLQSLYKRMLEEEIGAGFYDHCTYYETLDIFVDKGVGEVGILGVIETDLSVGELNEFRKSARDGKREFVGPNLIDIPATEAAIINFCMKQPTSINGFVTYTPHLLQLLFRRQVFEKIDL